MKDMNRMNGMGMDNFPMSYDVIVNTNSPLNKKLLDNTIAETQEQNAKHLFDLARLSQHLLTGKELTDFIGRSVGYMG